MRNDEHLAATHVFCVYFGDATYEWREAEDCVDFDCELAEHLRGSVTNFFICYFPDLSFFLTGRSSTRRTPHTPAPPAPRVTARKSLSDARWARPPRRPLSLIHI